MTRITFAKLHRHPHRLEGSLHTAQGSVPQVRETWLIELRDENGRIAWGEAAPWPAHGTEGDDAVAATLGSITEQLRGTTAEQAFSLDHGQVGPSAQWALDTALGDLGAQVADVSLASYWAGREIRQSEIPTSALMRSASRLETEQALAESQHTLKLKVGFESLRDDVARVASVRTAVGPDVALRLDANGAWQAEEALAALEALKPFSPEFVEQPVAASDPLGLADVCKHSAVPIALDESLVASTSPAELLEIGASVWVLKPAALGLSRFRVLAEEADRVGVKIVVSSLLDGDVSVGAALHLAAGRPEPFIACGLDLCFTKEVVPSRGFVRLPSAAGLGWRP
ncbi:MAG: hypothetical protein GY937_14855 [bacterium]|nr:hypothetical protein [bacterium]